ncbi:Transcription activator AMTR1 [Cladobotryum mycophilum]|uniref:Transcription activator AMTR1 n=1 Tax=Cladobotryum mycophilum TaxID=491253 RepID=A0ABR0SQP6_9HYPO
MKGVHCPGYSQSHKFIDEGVNVRRRYARCPTALMPQASAAAPSPAARNQENDSWNDQAQPASPNDTMTNMDEDEDLSMHSEGPAWNTQDQAVTNVPESLHHTNEPNTEKLNHCTAGDSINLPGDGSTIDDIGYPETIGSSRPSTRCSQIFNVAEISMSPGNSAPVTMPGVNPHGQDSPFPISELNLGSEHEIAFLTRHYSEVVGPWCVRSSDRFVPKLLLYFELSSCRLDLFDSTKFFGVQVPIMGMDKPLLKFAIAAVSAKQLGRVNGVKFNIDRGYSSPADTEVYMDTSHVDWFYKAGHYYHLTISYLRQALPDDYRDGSLAHISTTGESLGKNNQEIDHQISMGIPNTVTAHLSTCKSSLSVNTLDDLLAAASILTAYEFMDASGLEWARHLDGVKSLLDILGSSTRQLRTPLDDVRIPETYVFSRAQRAVFWNFAREDYLAAYINGVNTRLDTEDGQLWRWAGLPLDDQGCLGLTPSKEGIEMEKSPLSREDLAANALVWLLSNLVNLLSCSEETPRHQQSWLGVLNTGARLPFPEIVYGLPSCAATMQHYHFAQLLLILHEPLKTEVGSAPATARVRRYRELMKRIDQHCKEICGISLGKPAGAARIHMLQPLFLAGQLLEEPREQQIVIDLLRGIEADLGWATAYRVEQLLSGATE